MFVTVDRPQGAFSIRDGEVQIFQNRRIRTIDGKGLGEDYNEEEDGEGVHTNNTYYVGLIDSNCSEAQRLLQIETQDSPVVMFSYTPTKQVAVGKF